MAAVANNPSFAKKVGISKSIGEEFMKADKGKKFGSGGSLKATDSSENPGLSKLPTEVRNKMGYMKKGGMHKMPDGKMMKDSDMAKKKMNMGGMAYKEGGMADMAQDKKTAKKAVGMHEKQLHGGKKSDLAALKKGGMAKMKSGGMAKMKSGGMAKCAKGGGIEVRGKTKGKMCQENNMAKKYVGGGSAKVGEGKVASGAASENEFEKIRREHRERDAASPEGKQKESEKKLEETAKKIEEGKIPAPSSDDMGPLPAKKKGGKITTANYDKEYGKIYRKAVKKMSSGGTASSRADGCAVRGKTKA